MQVSLEMDSNMPRYNLAQVGHKPDIGEGNVICDYAAGPLTKSAYVRAFIAKAKQLHAALIGYLRSSCPRRTPWPEDRLWLSFS